jgi:hypothetical protein
LIPVVFEECLNTAGDYKGAADYAEGQAEDDGDNKGGNEGDYAKN